MAITTIKIHPAIGIARIGNSPEYFVGPEFPGDHAVPPGGYKDSQCRIKKQAARFRLFAYDENGVLVQEITNADAVITWTVHLANAKAANDMFSINGAPNPGPRNATVTGAARNSLIIDPGARTLNGPNQQAGFNTGFFMGSNVPLGEMRTENDSRLLVLGGWGNSGSPTNQPILHWAENDEWFDDISDGPVNATVQLNGTNVVLNAMSAWVICPPPKYAPPFFNFVTLYETLGDAKGWLIPAAQPSFNNDIYPILSRMAMLKWIFDYSQGTPSYSGDPHSFISSLLPPPGPDSLRQTVLNKLRNPATAIHQPTPATNMPKAWSDTFDYNLMDFSKCVNLALTATQYANMQQWAANNFINDWTGAPPVPVAMITPEGLDQAALENCVGGAFFPGIETSWKTRDEFVFAEPFRLDVTQRQPGDLTRQMALPWQGDFNDCSYEDKPFLWWPAQRPLFVWPEDGSPQDSWTRDLIRVSTNFTDSATDMVQNWSRLGMIVSQGNQFVETERRIVCKSSFIILNRSVFSSDQVDAYISNGVSADFDESFYVVMQGFSPASLGITGSGMTPAQLQPVSPAIVFTKPDNSATPGMHGVVHAVLLEDESNLNALQRVTFVYSVHFDNLNAFAQETENEILTATLQGISSTNIVTLNHQPNPFMLDGPTPWLSVDVCVFKMLEGDNRFGVTMGNDGSAAVGFIQQMLNVFNTAPVVNHPFDQLLNEQETTKLELSKSVDDSGTSKNAFNFAIAKVHYQGQVLSATDVRVFFRLFTTAATGTYYDSISTYPVLDDGAKVVPLLGFEGGEVVSIPCFGTARKNTSSFAETDQPDDMTNRFTFGPTGAMEAHHYFGCWLDFNQTDLVIPTLSFPGTGPYGANVKSIQDSIRGLHQCLVAEINFVGQPIPQGISPASTDKLSQRNLTIVESDNPGGVDAHTVAHTFELKPSVNGYQSVQAIVQNPIMYARAEQRTPSDELMIRWYDLPRDTDIQLFIPAIDTDELLSYMRVHYDAKRLVIVDDHTVRVKTGGVTYLPLPSTDGRNIAALMTLIMPDTVRHGEQYKVVAHQVSGYRRKIIGSFQLSIPISVSARLREPEERALSVMRWISRSIKNGDRWRPVFDRYLDVISRRVLGFGGDPDLVIASPGGVIVKPGSHEPCAEKPAPCDEAVGNNLFCVNIPWDQCCIEGDIRLRLKFLNHGK